MRRHTLTFTRLYADEFEKLVVHARRFGAPDPEAAVQEAAITVARLVGRGGVRNPKGLLFRATESKAINAYNREQAKGALPIGLLFDQDDADHQTLMPLAAPSFEQVEFADAFDRALRGLDAEDRDAFVLTYLRGLTVRAAAAVLRTPYVTVYRRAERARIRLRKETT